jgi:hypothetical protein
LIIKDGEVKQLEKVEETPTISFDFVNVCDSIGINEDQMVQNLNSFMKSA